MIESQGECDGEMLPINQASIVAHVFRDECAMLCNHADGPTTRKVTAMMNDPSDTAVAKGIVAYVSQTRLNVKPDAATTNPMG